jgi:hypothetical protein
MGFAPILCNMYTQKHFFSGGRGCPFYFRNSRKVGGVAQVVECLPRNSRVPPSWGVRVKNK